jgi:MinD-like ATPase involved in chromosome partitioning or flagellar assembly
VELPTYTSIWRIEKRLYKLYDFRLPMPLPVGQIAVFAAITIPYVVLLTVLGLPFNHNLFWLYVLPPGVLTWLATRPVLESKRLPELISSQLRYLGEPSSWCRMAPLAEKEEIALYGRVWRRGQAALVLEATEAEEAAAVAEAEAEQARLAGARSARKQPRRTRQPGIEEPGTRQRGRARAQVPPPEWASRGSAAPAQQRAVSPDGGGGLSAGHAEPAAGPKHAGRDADRRAPKRARGREVEPGVAAVGWPVGERDIGRHATPRTAGASVPAHGPGQGSHPPEWGRVSHQPGPEPQRQAGSPAPAVARWPGSAPERADSGVPEPLGGSQASAVARWPGSGPERAGFGPSEQAGGARRPVPERGALPPITIVPAHRFAAGPSAPGGPGEHRVAGAGAGVAGGAAAVDAGALVAGDGRADGGPPGGRRADGAQTGTGWAGDQPAGARARGDRPAGGQADLVPFGDRQPGGGLAGAGPVGWPGDPGQAAGTRDASPQAPGAPAASAQDAGIQAVSSPAGDGPGQGTAAAGGAQAEDGPAVGAGAASGHAGVASDSTARAGAAAIAAVGAAVADVVVADAVVADAVALGAPPPDSGTAHGAGVVGTRPAGLGAADRVRGEAPALGPVPVRGTRQPPAVERALGGPGGRPAAGWRSHVTVVPGGQGPGRPDPVKEARARAVLPLARPHLVVVLGCTVGAGQTVTALMLAELLASMRGEPVAALDLNPGPSSLTELAGLPAIPVSALLAPRASTGQPAHAAPRRGQPGKAAREAPGRPDIICDDPAGEGSWTAGGQGAGAPGIRLVSSPAADGTAPGGGDRGQAGGGARDGGDGQAASRGAGAGLGAVPRAGGVTGRPSRLFEFLASRYPLTLADPGAAAVARVLPAAGQLVLVAPASPDAASAVGMTLEWLSANGHGALSANSIVVINGVSQRSAPHAEQAGVVVRGRCRAIVRVPWDDQLAEPEAERGIRESLTAGGAPSRLERLRPPVRQAYIALAGVLVSALATGPQRGRAAR